MVNHRIDKYSLHGVKLIVECTTEFTDTKMQLINLQYLWCANTVIQCDECEKYKHSHPKYNREYEAEVLWI